MTQKYVMLVLANSKNNNNKFYEIRLEDNNEVRVRYGRVDGAVQQASKGHGLRTFESVANEKRKKGYKDVEVVIKQEDGHEQRSLSEVAKRDVIGNDPVLTALLERLVRINRHELIAASGGRITIEDGEIRTGVGLITLGSVESAKRVLGELQGVVDQGKTGTDRYATLLDQYLTLVPQKVPHSRGWGPDFFKGHTTFQRQNDLLEQLEASLMSLRQRPAPPADQGVAPDAARLFSYSIRPVDDRQKFQEIEKFFKSQVNSRHVSARLRLKAVYEMLNPDAETQYEAVCQKVGNPQRLWHGTRACNLLSIFKSGLIIPRSSGGNFTISGRMFGDGLYFSDQSTKSLNYSYGYWGHGDVETNCFMFLCDVAMGRSYVPSGKGNGHKPGYDSCFAQAGVSGVLNNEMIVYNIHQARLRYLCEFEQG